MPDVINFGGKGGEKRPVRNNQKYDAPSESGREFRTQRRGRRNETGVRLVSEPNQPGQEYAGEGHPVDQDIRPPKVPDSTRPEKDVSPSTLSGGLDFSALPFRIRACRWAACP